MVTIYDHYPTKVNLESATDFDFEVLLIKRVNLLTILLIKLQWVVDNYTWLNMTPKTSLTYFARLTGNQIHYHFDIYSGKSLFSFSDQNNNTTDKSQIKLTQYLAEKPYTEVPQY